MSCGPGELAAELARLSPAETIADASVPGIRHRAGKGGFESVAGERALKSRFGLATLDGLGAPSRAELAAAGGLLAYLDATQKGAGILLDAPRRIARASHMAIDAASRDSLELTRSVGGSVAGSLLGEIDRCQTAAGRRLLCEDIAAPLTDRARDRRAPGAGRVAARGCDPARARACRAKGHARLRARAGPARRGAWQPARPGLLRDGLAAAAALQTRARRRSLTARRCSTPAAAARRPRCVGRQLSRALVASPPLDASKGGYIAEGYDAELDALRDAASNGRRAIAALEARYRESTAISSLKIRHNAVLGYHVEVSARHADRLMAPDSGFTHRQTLAGAVRFNSPELHEEASRVDRSRRARARRRGRACRGADRLAVAAAPQITATAEAIARIDVAASHAHRAAEGGWIHRS